jgi:integrase
MNSRLDNPETVQSSVVQEDWNVGTHYQEGSIVVVNKRRPMFAGKYNDYERQADGSIKRVSKTVRLGLVSEIKTEARAKKLLKKITDPLNEESYRPKEKMTILRASEKWMKIVVSQQKASGRASTKSNLKRVLDAFGDMECTEVRPPDIQEWISHLATLGLSRVTIKNYLTTFKMLWASLEDWEYVDYDPFRRIKVKKGKKVQPFFTLAQMREIIDRTEDVQFRMMFEILAETGCRGGELCGLFTSDVDIEARTITIRRSAYQGHLQTTKTDSADRVVHISSFLAERIKQYTSFCGGRDRVASHDGAVQERKTLNGRACNRPPFDAGINGGIAELKHGEASQAGKQSCPQNSLLFPLPGKLAWDNADIVREGLKPVVRAMGIDVERMGLHSFRHGSKSLMLHLGVPEKYRCERQGHSMGGNKMDLIYSHSDVEHHRQYAEMIGRELFAAKKPVSSETVQSRAMGAD